MTTVKMPTVRCLRHVVTGQLFAATPALMEHPQLEPYQGPLYGSDKTIEHAPQNRMTPESEPLVPRDLSPVSDPEKDVSIKSAAARKPKPLPVGQAMEDGPVTKFTAMQPLQPEPEPESNEPAVNPFANATISFSDDDGDDGDSE